MIEHFLESSLVIDDKAEEAKPLITELETMDIWVRHFTPDDLSKMDKPLKNRKLIFLDLYLDEKIESLAGNLSLIRGIFAKNIGTNFGNYGLIVWTKHPDEVKELIDRLAKDRNEYQLPLFILPLPKTTYLENGYSTLLDDLNNLLRSNTASNFFVYWDLLVSKSKDFSIQSIYSLTDPSYKQLENDLKFILHKIAHNQTGIPLANYPGYRLEHDAIQGMANLLSYDIVHQHTQEIDIFNGQQHTNFSGDRPKVFALLNSKFLISFKGLDQEACIPGNVYQIMEDNDPYLMSDIPDGATKIIIEITPPCDLAQNKKGNLSRVVGGFFTANKASVSNFQKPVFYNFLKGIMIQGNDEPQYFIFDYRVSGIVQETDLKNSEKYKLLFRFKEIVFADILQKASSHTARLGIPFIS